MLNGVYDMALNIRKFEVVDSTQEYILRNLDTCTDYEIVVADIQTKGRGRGANAWYSFEGGLTFSMKMKTSRVANAMHKFSSIVKDTLTMFGVPGLLLKWPNDIYAQPAAAGADPVKIGGVLVNVIEEGDACTYIAGVGLNLHKGNGPYCSVEDVCGKRVDKEAFLTLFRRNVQDMLHSRSDIGEILDYEYVLFQNRLCEIIGIANDGLLVIDGGERTSISPAKYRLDYASHEISEK